VPPEQLLATAESLGATSTGQTRFHLAATPADALEEARELAGYNGLICVTGSLFLAAEARTLLLKDRAADP
jgi:dihydrofolate synthase/folylpolyglutamate synthase